MHRQINSLASNVGHRVSSASSKIKELVSQGLFEHTLKFYKAQFHLYAVGGNDYILPSVIKACSSQFLKFGIQLHSFAIKTAIVSDTVAANSLLAMYAKCSHIKAARQVFDTMPVRDTITWNSMITSYIQNGDGVEAIAKFKQMCASALHPKPELIASILSACVPMGELKLGRQIHAHVVCSGTINHSVYLQTAVLDMYARCFDLGAACQVFNSMDRNEVSWTAMIAGCNTNKCYNMSLNFFRAMHTEGFKPNRVTLIAALPACAELGALKHGKQIHGHAFRHEFESESHLATALIDMYWKCEGEIRYASLVFERSKVKDVVMWSSMIRNYSECEHITKAMELFHQMRMEGIHPNSTTLLAIIKSYTTSHAESLHGYIVKTGLDSDLFIGNSLIDMYGSHGCLDAAHHIFNEIPARDSVSWSALIRSYGLYGYGAEALQLFHQMQEKEIEPDEVAFLAVLSACNHGGLLDEGQKLFEEMKQNNKIAVTIEHYACYIDLLGRFGNIEEALEVISKMPMKSSTNMRSSLVSWCKVHGRIDMAKILIQELISSEPDNAANYTMLRMIYVEAGDWHCAEVVQTVQARRRMKKSYGYSRLELESFVSNS